MGRYLRADTPVEEPNRECPIAVGACLAVPSSLLPTSAPGWLYWIGGGELLISAGDSGYWAREIAVSEGGGITV